MTDYSKKLRDPRWQKKRLEIMQRDDFKCKYCASSDRELQIHHLKYTAKNPFEEPDENLITACCDCHEIITQLTKIEFSVKKVVRYQHKDGASTIFIRIINNESSEDLMVILRNEGELKVVSSFLFNSVRDIINSLSQL